MAYNDPTLQEIKDRLNIADVISGYIQTKKAGVNFKAVCPFHSEKTPSLVISPQKQIWHCFGCGEGGDIFGFVMKYENLEFKEALKLLADKAGVRLPEYKPQDPKVQSEKELLLRINNFAARFYHEILVADKRGSGALRYLEQRGLTRKTIEQWQIGFAPDDFHVLEKALQKKKVNILDMVKAGVSAKNERGQVYDRFRGRITFPIFNYTGEVVGFSARILHDDGKSAKYVNSPETVIYNKSKLLFGLNFAKNEIRKKDEVIIVEGQMDCITPHQHGITNVVASSGTALTMEQLQLLGRLTKNLKFCFDGDAAGMHAARRAIELYLGQDFTIKIVDLGGAKDPDELLKENPQKFVERIEAAKLFLDYYIDKSFESFNGASVEQKKNIAKDLLPLVKYLTDPLEQDHYLHLLADKFSTSPEVLRQALRKIAVSKAGQQPVASVPAPFGTGQGAVFALEKEVLGGVLWNENFKKSVAGEARPEDFIHKEIFDIIKPIFTGGQPESDSPLAKESLFMVESQLEQIEGNHEAMYRQLQRTFAMLKVASFKRQQLLLEKQIKQAQNSGQTGHMAQLNQSFASLLEKRLKFEKLI